MQGVQDSDTTVYHVIDQTTASHLGPPRSSTELYASLVSYIFLAVASIFGNILVIGAYVKNERLQRDIRYTFIIGLACADLLVGLVSLPIWIYITFSAHNDTPYHRTLYQVYITVDIFIGSASILQLAGISVERSYAVVRPVKHRLLNRKTLNNAVTVTWLFSAALASIQPLQYGTHWQMIYTMVMTTLCFFIPTVVIITAYCCIFATIKTKKTMANHRTNKNCFTKEVRLSFTVAMITLLFVITWLPLFSLTLLATFNPEVLPPSTSSERLSHFVKWMHYCSSALNPFLYAYRHKDLYRTLVVLLRRPVFKKCPRVDEDLRSYRSGSVSPSNGVRKLHNPRNTKRKSSSNKQKRIALSDTTANSSWIIYETSRKRKKPDDHCTVV